KKNGYVTVMLEIACDNSHRCVVTTDSHSHLVTTDSHSRLVITDSRLVTTDSGLVTTVSRLVATHSYSCVVTTDSHSRTVTTASCLVASVTTLLCIRRKAFQYSIFRRRKSAHEAQNQPNCTIAVGHHNRFQSANPCDFSGKSVVSVDRLTVPQRLSFGGRKPSSTIKTLSLSAVLFPFLQFWKRKNFREFPGMFPQCCTREFPSVKLEKISGNSRKLQFYNYLFLREEARVKLDSGIPWELHFVSGNITTLAV
ncbi:hypothetical protein U1Q18_048432, partial [Sarracenia purpurea var. burkii]